MIQANKINLKAQQAQIDAMTKLLADRGIDTSSIIKTPTILSLQAQQTQIEALAQATKLLGKGTETPSSIAEAGINLSSLASIMPGGCMPPTKGMGHKISKSLIFFFLLTFLLAYFHKIPFVGRFLARYSPMLNIVMKSRAFRTLVFIRNLFVALNALIGLLMILDITGFTLDGFIGNLYTLGVSYLNGFWWICNKVYDFIYNIFNYATPKPPTDVRLPDAMKKPTPPLVPYDIFQNNSGNPSPVSQPATVSQPAPVVNVNINNGGGSRYAGGVLDWIAPQWGVPAWIWYPALSAISAAALYYGSEYVKSILMNRGAVGAANVQGGGDPAPAGGWGSYLYGLFAGVGHSVSNGAQATSDGVVQGVKTVGHYLNPWTYFSSTPDGANSTGLERMAREFFIANQTDPARANENYYPHTLKDPQMSYIQQWRVAVFGLTREAEEARQAALQVYRDNVQHINRPSELGPTVPGLTVGGLRVDEVPSGARTPTGSGVGIFGAGFDERVAASIHEVNRGQAIREALEGLVTKGKNVIHTAYEEFTTQDVEDTQSVWENPGVPAEGSERSIDLADRRNPTPPQPLSDMDKLRFENPKTNKDIVDAAIYAKQVQASASNAPAVAASAHIVANALAHVVEAASNVLAHAESASSVQASSHIVAAPQAITSSDAPTPCALASAAQASSSELQAVLEISPDQVEVES